MSARPGLGLRAGDVVTLHVIKRLTDDKWAVGLKGRVLPARTDLDLSPGATLRARVQSAAGRVVFVLERGPALPVADALLRAGVPDTPEARLIAAALVSGGKAVDPGTIDRVRALLAKSRLEARRGARAAATMLDKGIDLASTRRRRPARAALPCRARGPRPAPPPGPAVPARWGRGEGRPLGCRTGRTAPRAACTSITRCEAAARPGWWCRSSTATATPSVREP